MCSTLIHGLKMTWCYSQSTLLLCIGLDCTTPLIHTHVHTSKIWRASIASIHSSINPSNDPSLMRSIGNVWHGIADAIALRCMHHITLRYHTCGNIRLYSVLYIYIYILFCNKIQYDTIKQIQGKTRQANKANKINIEYVALRYKTVQCQNLENNRRHFKTIWTIPYHTLRQNKCTGRQAMVMGEANCRKSIQIKHD